METSYCNIFSTSSFKNLVIDRNNNQPSHSFRINSSFQKLARVSNHRLRFQASLAVTNPVEETPEVVTVVEEKPRFKWLEVSRSATEEQKHAISQIPVKMMKRCKALMRQIICFSPEKGSLCDLLAAWVRLMKPIRADWLSVLRELKKLDHPFYIKVAKIALLEDSFEANVRDYTKVIQFYGEQNQLQEAETILSSMKKRDFICDQVILTAMVNLYSKADNLALAEATFEEILLLGEQLDKRSYGSMIMAYIRANLPEKGEELLREMDAQEIYAGSEVYKALLRSYSMAGNTKGAQRIFDAIQLAGISPDPKHCALLINAYKVADQTQNTRIAFENMKRAGLEPTDKCVALVLAAYEKESKLNEALEFLVELERDGIVVGIESSRVLAGWFRRLGVVDEIELILREYATNNCS